MSNDKVKKTVRNIGSYTSNVTKELVNAANTTKDVAVSTVTKTKELAESAKEKTLDVMDINGDGIVDIEDIIILSFKLPGIKVDREDFLRKEFLKNHTEAEINDIIAFNPAHAKVSSDEIDKIANEVIKFERNCVSGISAALGMPGGATMAATIPADIAQYYGYMIRAAQKLMYLYGFPELNIDEKNNQLDSETVNILTLCLGTMYGVAGAKNALIGIAKALGSGVEKQLMKKALTKGAIYPIVKEVSKWFGVRMTKEVFSGFFKKAIPVAGGLIGGGITYVSFKPCCEKLKKSLQDTMLSNPEGKNTNAGMDIFAEENIEDVIDVEFEVEGKL